MLASISARLLATIAVLGAGCHYDPSASIGTPDAAAPGPDVTATPLLADVVAVDVTAAAGGAPAKGDRLAIAITVRNLGTTPGRVRVRPQLTSTTLADFIAVPVGDAQVELDGEGSARVVVLAGPFVDDDARGKRYALGRGSYAVTGVTIEHGGAITNDSEYDGGAFDVAASDVVFTAVVYDPAYFQRIGYTGSAEHYLEQAFTRAAQLYTPGGGGSGGPHYDELPGGFDQLMGVQQRFRAIDRLTASAEAGGFCEQIGSSARAAFGLTRDWDVDESAGATDPDHHGFDLLVGLTPAMVGGAACGWLGIQVSGLFDFDLSLDRAQIILVHETGHLFGAPDCDPLQGYVMCSGEKHPHYQDERLFVWHRMSRDAMANRWR